MDTLFPLTLNTWTAISTSDAHVFQSEGLGKVIYRVAASEPSAYQPDTDPVYNVTVNKAYFEYRNSQEGLTLWAWLVNGDAKVSVTPLLNSGLPDGLFYGDRAMTVQFYTEANVKRGLQHEASALFTIAAGANNDTIFLTGSKPVALKGRSINFDGFGVVGEIYTGATYTGGSPAVYQNASDINPVAGGVQIIVGSTITNTGTLAFAPAYAFSNASNQGKGGLQPILGDEKNLKPNTAYLLRLRSLDTQTQRVSSFLSWYEGGLDLSLPTP